MTAPREIDEQTEKHIERFLAGKEVWNKWARDMLARKEKLVEESKWQVTWGKDDEGRWRDLSDNSEVQAWLNETYVDFSFLSFQTEQNSSVKSQGGGEENVQGIQDCTKSIFVSGNLINFGGFLFPHEASFTKASFKRAADFSKASFKGTTFFSEASFRGVAGFVLASFKGTAFITETSFKGVAGFVLASFKGWADFHAVDFFKTTSFYKTRFSQSADFEAIEVKRAFSLADAQFLKQVPNFSQAHFAESPRLDHVEVRPFIKKKSPFSWQRYFWQERFFPHLKRGVYRAFLLNPLNSWRRFCNSDRNPDDEAYYRALKRLAIQAHDHENEMKFFAGELRSRRHIKDFASPLKGIARFVRYWFGVLYEVTSDFGRSIWRPAVWWGATFALFASLYFANATPSALEKCRESQAITPFAAANTIAAKHSLPFFTMDRSDKFKRSLSCLYGAAPLYHPSYYVQEKTGQPKAHSSPKSPPKPRFHMVPAVPGWVTVLGVGNMVLSLVFLFLLLLAIRNQFRIK